MSCALALCYSTLELSMLYQHNESDSRLRSRFYL